MNLSVLPEINIIKSKNVIKDILDNGTKIYTRFGIFFLKKNTEEKKYIAVLIKKSIGIAVKRNYYKRILREYLRNNIDKFPDYNQIIFLFNGSGNATYADIKEEFGKKIKF